MAAARDARRDDPKVPSPVRGLSGRLLLLTIGLVLLGEVLIYVPSISRFRVQYLTERLGTAHLATTLLLTAEGAELDDALERRLLDHARMEAIAVTSGERMLTLGAMVEADATYRLAEETVPQMIRYAFVAMSSPGERIIRVIGPSPLDPAVTVEVALAERAMCEEMLAYSGRILQLSLFLSVLVAGSLFLLLQRLIVRPLRELTGAVTAFRRNPEDPDALADPPRRSDEIGVVQGETRRMQERVRDALRQRERLAALGAAVGKINHDLRNVLASAMLLSDRLETSADPNVKRVAPRLLDALERATRLCSQTLAFARAEEPPLVRSRFALAPFAAAAAERWSNHDAGVRIEVRVPPRLEVVADPDQLARIFDNLLANAVQAMAPGGGTVTLTATGSERGLAVRIADTGPGLPESVRTTLFEPFVSAGRKNGTGLGLHIAREIARRHGGDLVVERTGPDGTAFRLDLLEGTEAQATAAA